MAEHDISSSVMANIAEGFDAGSDAEFIRFLGYARRSASEVQPHLYIALDRGYVTKEEFKPIYHKATQAKKLINGFIRYLRKSQDKTTRPKTKNQGPSDQRPPDQRPPDQLTRIRPSAILSIRKTERQEVRHV